MRHYMVWVHVAIPVNFALLCITNGLSDSVVVSRKGETHLTMIVARVEAYVVGRQDGDLEGITNI